MLIRFVYLDKPILEGFAAQLDGGLIAETKVHLVKKRAKTGEINLKFARAKLEGGGSDDRELTMSYPPEAQYQRLLAVARDNPEAIAWIDVVDPNNDFASAQVGETILWECDVEIDQGSRLIARGGGGVQMAALMDVFVTAGQAGLSVGNANYDTSNAEQLKAQTEVMRQLFDSLNISRIAVGRDSSTTTWSIFGPLHNDHLRVENIENERLIVVGKIKRIVPYGQSRKLVNNEAMQLMETFSTSSGRKNQSNPMNYEIEGPALELDIIAIYR